jgi:hypothetical protein
LRCTLKTVFRRKNLKTLKNPVILLIILGLILTACAKPPTEEMDNALAALTRAENDPDAVMYAANLIARARSALTQLQAEAAAKRYDAARTYAQETIREITNLSRDFFFDIYAAMLIPDRFPWGNPSAALYFIY